MTSLVVPLGHYLGGDPTEHLVRVGRRSARLRHGAEVTTWMLAHGIPELVAAEPWTVEAVRRAAGPDAARVTALLGTLAEQGLLVDVDPEENGEIEGFARAHRLCPLLTGLGAHPELPGWYALGRPGEPLVLVPEFAYEIWRWAPRAENLWELGLHLAEAEQAVAEVLDDRTGRDRVDDGRLDDAEPRQVLIDLLYALHLLLANHAAYVDEC